jgi:hypothetical protein
MIEIQLPLVTSLVEARLDVGKIRFDEKYDNYEIYILSSVGLLSSSGSLT